MLAACGAESSSADDAAVAADVATVPSDTPPSPIDARPDASPVDVAVPDVAGADTGRLDVAVEPDIPGVPDSVDVGIDGGHEVSDEVVDDVPVADAPLADEGPAADVGPEVPPLDPYDCENLPQGPFQLTKLNGPLASEDLAFDMAGNLVAGNDTAIFKSPKGGPPQLFVPNMHFRAGLRYLPSGHLIVADNNKGELVRIDPDGVRHPVMTGLAYPNGLEVDLAGWVYFSEHSADVVWRVNPFDGTATVVTDRISTPNGLSFSPDYRTLYIDAFDGDPTIWAVSIAPDGTPGRVVAWATGVGEGYHDGMAVDACGNVYVADYGETVIYRVSADGQTVEPVIDGVGFEGAYLPNMQWGSGFGGYDRQSLYLPDGWNKGVFEVQIGVPSKPAAYP